MKIANICILTLVILCGSKAYCYYDDTKWGMTVDKIQSMYPSGQLTKGKDAKITYWIVRNVAGFTNAVVGFTFDERQTLSQVTVIIPDKLSTPSLNDIFPSFEYAEKEECEENYETLYKKLHTKYGKLKLGSHGDPMIFWWAKHDKVMMMRVKDSDKKKESIFIYYQKFETGKKATEGL
jgi:hypothetical protein